MTNGLVFNHHSLPFANRYDAEANISEFIKICSAAKTQAQLTTILLDESIDASWFRVELCTGYCFRDWFTQNKDNDKDLIRIFRSIITNSPLFNADDVGGDLELFDVKEKTTQSRLSALRAALWYDRLLCSFPSKPPWNSNPLDVIIEQCHPGGELTEKTKQLTNLVTLADWDSSRCKWGIYISAQ